MADWTDVTSVNRHYVLLYNANSGATYVSYISDYGAYQAIGAGPNAGTTWRPVGATNGTVLFYPWTVPGSTGRLGNVNTAGALTMGSNVSGLQYASNLSAE